MVLLWIAPTTQSLRFGLEIEEPPNDIHEFTVLPGNTAITTVFEPVQYNLSAYGVSQPVGWVLEGIFQEIDIQTSEVLFEWRPLIIPAFPKATMKEAASAKEVMALQSKRPGITCTLTFGFPTLQGCEINKLYSHLNAVEKDDDGNYLISSRYLCTLFKINGKDGSIMWRLNGKKNEFKGMFGCKSAPSHNCSIRAPFSVTRSVISDGYHRGSFESVIKAIVRWLQIRLQI
jgi:hypothetical protein